MSAHKISHILYRLYVARRHLQRQMNLEKDLCPIRPHLECTWWGPRIWRQGRDGPFGCKRESAQLEHTWTIWDYKETSQLWRFLSSAASALSFFDFFTLAQAKVLSPSRGYAGVTLRWIALILASSWPEPIFSSGPSCSGRQKNGSNQPCLRAWRKCHPYCSAICTKAVVKHKMCSVAGSLQLEGAHCPCCFGQLLCGEHRGRAAWTLDALATAVF